MQQKVGIKEWERKGIDQATLINIATMTSNPATRAQQTCTEQAKKKKPTTEGEEKTKEQTNKQTNKPRQACLQKA